MSMYFDRWIFRARDAYIKCLFVKMLDVIAHSELFSVIIALKLFTLLHYSFGLFEK